MGLDRLRREADFRLAYRGGRRIVRDHVVVYLRFSGAPACRIGIPVGRRFGGAVRRNRLRRRLREAIRQVRDLLPQGIDLVVVPRSGAGEAPFSALVDAVAGAVREGLREEPPGRPEAGGGEGD